MDDTGNTVVVRPRLLKTLAPILRRRRAGMVLLAMSRTILGLAEAAVSIALGWGVAAITVGDWTRCASAVAAMVGLVALRILVSLGSHTLSKRIEVETQLELQASIASVALSKDLGVMSTAAGRWLETMDDDASTVANVPRIVVSIIVASIVYLIVGVYVLTMSWVLGLVCLASAAVLSIGVPKLTDALTERLTPHREDADAVDSYAVDIAMGLRTLRGLNAIGVFRRRYYDASDRLRDSGLALGRMHALVEGARVLLPATTTLVIVLIGVAQLQAGVIDVAALVAFYGLSLYLVEPMDTLVASLAEVAELRVAATRVAEVVHGSRSSEKDSATPDPALARSRPGGERGGRPSSASADTPTAERLSGPWVCEAWGLSATPGQFTVVCGAEGRDDQIALDLGSLLGPTSSIGATRLSPLGSQQWRADVVVAMGDDDLFDGTVASVVGLDRPGVDVAAALGAACATDIVDSSTEGENRVVLDGGKNLSGGQRQRLGLARALAGSPSYLALVRPTTAVDVATEAAIAAAVSHARRGKTTIVISDSPAFAVVADAIVRPRAASPEQVAGHTPREPERESRSPSSLSPEQAAADPRPKPSGDDGSGPNSRRDDPDRSRPDQDTAEQVMP
ncbi:MAG: ABC transporter ATP-binding protein/permease [Propionibacteriaceae bacterium]|jgi:ABC-type bacteriocin/lantibiotic exporter with double-glycine peptidase domain|nr:ABC transporter ATP-binding protein/permease [Propionibacteriaceae bacterium]